MKKFLMMAIPFLGVVFFGPSGSFAKELTATEKIFAEMKNNCHKKYEKFMAGTTDDMANGSYAYSECLQGQMEKITKNLFTAARKKEFFEELRGAATSYYALTNKIYFNHKKCDVHCGTMFIPLKIQAVWPIYENTLWQLLFINSEHKFDIPEAHAPEIERDRELWLHQ
jgi:hypothetical protein